MGGIALDKAIIISMILESLLYGMVPFAYMQPNVYSGCAAQPPRKIDRPDIDISAGGRGDLISHLIIL